MNGSNVLYIMSLAGVGVFAASGALAAGRKSFDLMGVAVLALVTALGGGTIRDVLLDRHPLFWIQDSAYLWVSLCTAMLTPVYVRFFRPPDSALLIADALGLALFTIAGTQIAEELHVTGLNAVLMGVFTGVAGGVLRDALSAEVPLLFKPSEPLYATAALIGASLYLGLQLLAINHDLCALLGMGVIAALRLAAILWKLYLPVFRLEDRT